MTTITTSRVQRHLAELTIWLPLLDEQAKPGLHSPTINTAHTSIKRGLPFNLDKTIDTTDEGETGVRTSAGVYEILQSWANQFASERSETRPIYPIAYLSTVTPKITGHADWEAYAETITNLRNHVAALIGYADQRIGTCPKCHGNIMTTPTREGLPEHGTCNGCDTWYADAEDIIRQTRAAYLNHIRTITRHVFYVPLKDILDAHPQLTKEKIMKWKQRGKIAYHPDHGYDISDINVRIQEKI